jgi:hypothetical protein
LGNIQSIVLKIWDADTATGFQVEEKRGIINFFQRGDRVKLGDMPGMIP